MSGLMSREVGSRKSGGGTVHWAAWVRSHRIRTSRAHQAAPVHARVHHLGMGDVAMMLCVVEGLQSAGRLG